MADTSRGAWWYRVWAAAAAFALMSLAGGTVYAAVGAGTHHQQSADGGNGIVKDTYVGSDVGAAKS